MDKAFYKLCIEKEVFDPYKNSKGKLNIIDRIWCKYISPESNSIYLVRKKQYYESRGGICRIYSRLIHAKLIRRYGIHITEGTNIDLGLRIAHPVGIVITKCSIGKNFQIYQNSTIGQKTRAGGHQLLETMLLCMLEVLLLVV